MLTLHLLSRLADVGAYPPSVGESCASGDSYVLSSLDWSCEWIYSVQLRSSSRASPVVSHTLEDHFGFHFAVDA